MTAYIKMIDIWMIFAMLYPFCVVALYSVLEFLKGQDQDIPVPVKNENKKWKVSKVVNLINFLLDFGLPVIVIIFIIIFWILGIINTNSAEVRKSCSEDKS